MKRPGSLRRVRPLARGRKGLARRPIRRKPYQPRRDPVTPDVYDDVMARDGRRCVGPRVGMLGSCGGRLELDHVLNAGHGRRGPSTRDNLVALCRDHHRQKTEHATSWRPMLIAWIMDIDGVRSSHPCPHA